MMTTLLRKDWRVYRPVVIGGAVLALAPYGLGLLFQWLFPSGGRENTFRSYLEVLYFAANFGWVLTVLMAAVYGGAAFAGERRDRTAEFMALLPVTRPRAVASKFAVAIGCLAATWLLHVAVARFCRWAGEDRGLFSGGMGRDELTMIPVFIVLAFGVAWMLSCLLNSPAIAAVGSIGTIVVLATLTTMATKYAVEGWMLNGREAVNADDYIRGANIAVSLVVGLFSLLIGTAHYIRRVRP